MDARVIVSEDTIKKANKPLSQRRKGELRTQKLKELAESGKLSMIKNRPQLAEAVGYSYTERSKAGYQWVKYKIDSGVLKERLVGYDKFGRGEFEYEYVEKKKTVPTTAPIIFGTSLNIPVENPVENVENSEPTVVAQTVLTLYHGETTISIEGVSTDTIVEIVKSIIK